MASGPNKTPEKSAIAASAKIQNNTPKINTALVINNAEAKNLFLLLLGNDHNNRTRLNEAIINSHSCSFLKIKFLLCSKLVSAKTYKKTTKISPTDSLIAGLNLVIIGTNQGL